MTSLDLEPTEAKSIGISDDYARKNGVGSVQPSLRKCGYSFDATSCKYNIDPSEKEANKLSVSYSMIAH